MNWRDTAQALVSGWASSSPTPEYQRSEVSDVIAQALAERMDAFTVQDALAMPSVRRAVDLITTIGASFEPVALDPDGARMAVQPSVVRKPDPFATRYDWTLQVLRSLVETGDAFLREGEGYTIVLDPDDVDVAWEDDRTKLRRTYTWQGQDVTAQVRHVLIGHGPGDLTGTSPIEQCLDQLAVLDAQERYAEQWFRSGGVPHTVLTSEWDMSPAETKGYKDAYVTARQDGTGVAALAKGYGVSFPGSDPESSQLTDSRDFANTSVARLLGIPGPLMLVQGGSAGSITYANSAGLVLAFARQTLLPMYINPLQAALSERVRGSVEYSVGELKRVDITERIAALGALQAMGIVDEREIALALGMDPSKAPGKPEPAPAPVPAIPDPDPAEAKS